MGRAFKFPLTMITAISLGTGAASAAPPPGKPAYNGDPYSPTQESGRQNVDWASQILIARNEIPINVTARNVTHGTSNGNASVVSIYVNGYLVTTLRNDSEQVAALAYLQGSGVYRIAAVCEAIRATPVSCIITVNRPPATPVQ